MEGLEKTSQNLGRTKDTNYTHTVMAAQCPSRADESDCYCGEQLEKSKGIGT